MDTVVCQLNYTGLDKTDNFTCHDASISKVFSLPTVDAIDNLVYTNAKTFRNVTSTTNGIQGGWGVHMMRKYNTGDPKDYVIIDGSIVGL